MKFWGNIVVVIFQFAMLGIVGGVAVHLWRTLPNALSFRAPPVPVEYEICPRADWLGRPLSASIRTAADGRPWRLGGCIYVKTIMRTMP